METLSFTPFSPNLPIFLLMYATIYLLGYFIIFRRWKGISRPGASSCFLSLAHGTPAVVLATYSLILQNHNKKTPLAVFASKNTDFENTILEYSIAYFTTDLLHYIIFLPNDVVFIAHHLATLYVFTTCRYVIHHGASEILVLLVIAEVTSACQNTWTLARLRRGESPAAAAVVEFLSPIFYWFYSVVRGFLGPGFVYRMGFFYWSGGGDGFIPKWAWISWMVVIVIAILMSILWVLKLWMDWYRERSKTELKKLS